MVANGTARQDAEKYLANPRFHQSVTVDSGVKYGPLVISYAEYGYHQSIEDRSHDNAHGDTEVPTVLFTPGMFGSRYIGTVMDVFAEKHKVRVLVPDRFGFGKTPDIPLRDRIDTFVAVVPKFLEALGVKHVALASHSAGTFYNLNLLWHCPEILHPIHPMVFFFAPFVDGACSQAPMVSALQALPVFSFSYWNKIASFFTLQASVVTGASAGILDNLAKAVTPGNNEPSETAKNMKVIEEKYGLSVDLQVELDKLVAKGVMQDETVGANSEALTCLKKGAKGLWGEAEDYSLLFGKIASQEREKQVKGQEKLCIRIYFSESDVMTGKKGQEYFQSCCVGEGGSHKDCFDIKATTIEKSNHDSVLGSAEALEEVFETAGKR